MLYEVVIDAIIVDLGVIGSPEPVRIVTVNLANLKVSIYFSWKYTWNCELYFRTLSTDTYQFEHLPDNEGHMLVQKGNLVSRILLQGF